MDVGPYQVIAAVVLVVSGSIGYIVACESGRPRYKGLLMFMGAKGQRFLNMLMVGVLLGFIAAATYLLFTAWILCAIGVPVTVILLGPLLSPIVLRVVVYPLYKLYEMLSSDNEG